MRLKKIIMKKTKSEDTISNDLWECVVELLQGVLNLLLLNPLIYPLLTVFIPKIIIGFACKDMYSIMWSFVSVYSTHSGRRNRYWFHYHTRLAYADISEQICVINGTKKEKDFYKIYSQKHVDTKVKSFGFWQNQNLSEDFRIHMLRHGYQITLSDLKFVLEKNQYLVIKEILKQTVSGEKSIIIWNRVIDKDDKDLFTIFKEYVIRESLSPRVQAYIANSYGCFWREAIRKALETQEAIACIKQCKPDDTFRQILTKGMEIPCDAQCLISADQYDIYKECGYELCEKAVIHHLQKEGEMAKKILFEYRDFTDDQMKVIMKSTKLTSWYNKIKPQL